MKILVDTNILIPLEPTSINDYSQYADQAVRLVELASRTNAQLWVHPAQRTDIGQDRDLARRNLRTSLFRKYPVLEMETGTPPIIRTNDWVDTQLAHALRRNAVDVLVTEDKRLVRKISSSDLGPDRVLSLADAIASLSALLKADGEAPPNVRSVRAYELDLGDPIWGSFRDQYPDFDEWLKKCQREHRQCWVIASPIENSLAAVAIVKIEEEQKEVRKLKICSFKVAPKHSGRRLGELLLKTIFTYAWDQKIGVLYLTVFPDHQALIALLEGFGFKQDRVLDNGEIECVKQLHFEFVDDSMLDSLSYFKQFGPFTLDSRARAFVVPIQPAFHHMLFPESQEQRPLPLGGDPYGNALRKAYLSSSRIKGIDTGSILYFYRSEDSQSVSTWGVVDKTLRSDDPSEICGFVLPRTVFSKEQIEEKCRRSSTLAIMFRQGLLRISQSISLDEIIAVGALSGPPQSITELGPEAREWMRTRCLKRS